jgi:hypothetical protein
MKNLLIFCALIVFLGGCKKERILYLSDDIKKNYSYKPGSYWIYRDSATGREDSCYFLNTITSFQEPLYLSRLSDYDKVELMVVTTKLATFHKSKKTNIEIEYYIYSDVLSGALDRSSSNSIPFGCNLPISEETIKKYNLSENLEFLSAFNLNGFRFNSVYQIKANTTLFFLNEIVGLLKMKVTYDSVDYNWEIVRHNVIK